MGPPWIFSRRAFLAGSAASLLGTLTPGFGCARSPSKPKPVDIRFRLADGTFDILADGAVVLERATADVLVDDGSPGGPKLFALTDEGTRTNPEPGVYVFETTGVTLTLSLSAAADGTVRARLEVTNTGSRAVTILRLAPIVVDASRGGALHLGKDPARHRILENGCFVALDVAAQAQWGDVQPFLWAQALPIPLRGNSVSNWSHAVASIDEPDQSLVAGWLTFDRAVPTLGIAFDPSAAPADSAGRRPFTLWAAECALVFHGKPLAPGGTLASEKFWLAPRPADPLSALEALADAIQAEHGIVPWSQRGPGHPSPSGWNSWTGGAGTGGYGQDMDEPTFLANLDVWVKELQPFGGAWFQIDDGWEPLYGDWEWRADRFPHGGAWLAEQIRQAGLTPGLWIAPMTPDAKSQFAHDHPDWLQKPETGLPGVVLGDRLTVDCSLPAVDDWLGQTFGTLRQESWKWAKVDFTYWDILGQHHDQTLTAIEAWREGYRSIRAALGSETFILGIGVMGANIGTLDAMRLTLDNAPRWDEVDPDDVFSTVNSFKATVRTGSRRWFYQNRVWVNDDDLVFFRSAPEASGVPPLTLEESRAFATWIALGGGNVTMGDKLVDLAGHPEWIDIARRLLPAWPAGAVPLDVMERDYPERWHLAIDAPAGKWDLIGLFHWGKNRDFSVKPEVVLSDTEPRSFTVELPEEMLVWAFWSERFLGRQKGSIAITVPFHSAEVLALRTPSGVPQLLSTNRHVTMGATDLGKVTWDGRSKTLSGTLAGAVGTERAPWSYRLAFYAPAPYSAKAAQVDGVAAATLTQDGEVVRLEFALSPGQQGQVVSWRVAFA